MEKTCFFKRIAELRLESGKTKAEIADVLGMSIATYIKHEKDGRFPASQIAQLADLYDVSMDYVLELSDERKRD